MRALTWVITALCLLCVDRLLHLAGVSPSRRLFALLVLLLNPLFFYFANTFMTEMYGYFPALLAAVVYFEYRRRGPVASRSRELQWWIGIALLSIASFCAGFSRYRGLWERPDGRSGSRQSWPLASLRWG